MRTVTRSDNGQPQLNCINIELDESSDVGSPNSRDWGRLREPTEEHVQEQIEEPEESNSEERDLVGQTQGQVESPVLPLRPDEPGRHEDLLVPMTMERMRQAEKVQAVSTICMMLKKMMDSKGVSNQKLRKDITDLQHAPDPAAPADQNVYQQGVHDTIRSGKESILFTMKNYPSIVQEICSTRNPHSRDIFLLNLYKLDLFPQADQ